MLKNEGVNKMVSSVYPPKDFKRILKASDIARRALEFIEPHIKPGVSTAELDDLIAKFIKQNDATSSSLGYHGFPKSCCISLNDVICHGIPSDKIILKEGDILNIDVTVQHRGYHGDTSRMYRVGRVSQMAEDVMRASYDSLMAAISICGPDVPLSEIGKTIERIVKPYKFGIARDFVGHGIGKVMHDNPQILHYYEPMYDKIKMVPGMVFTIEPMINTGTEQYKIDADGWTARTADGGLSAQWEHTIGITEDGAMIFTEKQFEPGMGGE